jgi:cysteine desulfurase
MTGRAYFDWNATAPLRAEAREAMLAAMALAGNPSSIHAEGRAARGLVEKARAQVAAAVGCAPSEVIFTSGATEAASVLARIPDGHQVSVDATAHDCLWAQARGAADAAGTVTLAMGLANNETGIVTLPPRKTGSKWHWHAVEADWLLLDVVQAIGRMAFSFASSGADMAVVSGHKFGGPKGVGALILRDGLEIAPLLAGGGQETGRRAGTENVVGIAGMGAAAEAAVRDLADGVWSRTEQLRDILESALSDPEKGTISPSAGMDRLPNTLCLVTPGWKGETQVMQMDLAGFAISAGSACSSGKVRPSRVLQAMGFDDVAAASAIRVSLGSDAEERDVMRFAERWLALRDRRPVAEATRIMRATGVGR